MQSSVVPTFRPLADLLDGSDTTCIYLPQNRMPCIRPVPQVYSNHPLVLLGNDLDILITPGGYPEASAQFELFRKFASHYMCTLHVKEHVLQAAEQWLNEFNTDRTSFTFKLQEYRNSRKSKYTQIDSDSSESEDSESDTERLDEFFAFGSRTLEADSGEDEFEEEAIQNFSTQSTLSIGAIHRSSTIEEHEAAQGVTWLLEQCLESGDKKPGWIYVVRLQTPPGMLKIGQSAANPKLHRLKQLLGCYGETELITMMHTPYANRVERLLRTEFSKNHYNMVCRNCGLRHLGFLDIDEEHLRRSLIKWIQFLESPSYSKSGELLPGAVLPPPASQDYLGCKRPPRRVFGHPITKQKAGSQVNYNMALSGVAQEDSSLTIAITPSACRLKDSDRADSGYASASRPATLAVLSEPAFQDDIELLAARKLDVNTHPYVDEIQSIASDNDDIGSQLSDETTNEGMTGKALIRVFLSEEPNFKSLCEKATALMGRQRFVENLRRLLKAFHKNLTVEAEAEAEKAVARLLRSRRGRLRISQQLALHFQQEQEEIGEAGRVNARVVPEDKQCVETWLRTLHRAEDPQEFEDQNFVNESGVSDSDDDSMTEEFPYISELEMFLRRARSFQALLKDFMLMFLPNDLRHVLLSIPKEQIWVSREQDVSLANGLKAWVEDSTKVRWNWWPFEARKRMLCEGESRMFWQCVSSRTPCARISLKSSRYVVRGSGKKCPPNKTSLSERYSLCQMTSPPCPTGAKRRGN